MKGYEIWDKSTLGIIINQTKTQIRKKKNSKISTKIEYLYTIQLDKTLKYD